MIIKNKKYVYEHIRPEITRFNNDLDCIQKSFIYFCIPNGVNTFAETSNHFRKTFPTPYDCMSLLDLFLQKHVYPNPYLDK